VPFHPKIALSSATVAPASAARVAAIFRQPCAERLNNPAPWHALPNDSLVSGLPFLPQINASSPVGPASSVRCSQDRYRDNHLALTLLGAQCGDVITDMLTTERDRIAAAQPGVEQHIAPDSFLGPNRPSPVISSSILLGPHRQARTLSALRVLHADSRIDRDVLCLLRPFELRIASRKLRACAGVAARLSRPLVITACVMLRIAFDDPPSQSPA